jgi:undecaprenyl diphosphate synthase
MRSDTSTQVLRPEHIAIVMDGNNRWAKQRHLPSLAGHRQGTEAVRKILRACRDRGLKALTLFAFSSENWRRPEAEVRGLMSLLIRYLRADVAELAADGVRLEFIGRRDRLNPRIARLIEESEAVTRHNTGFDLVVAFDYGGQWDIADAARRLAVDVAAGTMRADEIDESVFHGYLSLSQLPPVDLLIRTGGETRLSNFLLWQLAYTEFLFVDTLWPDFDAEQLDLAIESFARRQRRFGGRPEDALPELNAQKC